MTWNNLIKEGTVYKLEYSLKEERLDLSTVSVDQIIIEESIYDNASYHIFKLSDGNRLNVYLSQEDFCDSISVGQTSEESTIYGTSVSSVLYSVNCSTEKYSDAISLLELECYKSLNRIDKLKDILKNHEKERLSSISIYSIFPDGRMRAANLEPCDWISLSRFDKLSDYSYKNKSDGNIYYTTEWEAELHHINKSLNDNLIKIEELKKDKEHKIKIIEKLNRLKKKYGLQ